LDNRIVKSILDAKSITDNILLHFDVADVHSVDLLHSSRDDTYLVVGAATWIARVHSSKKNKLEVESCSKAINAARQFTHRIPLQAQTKSGCYSAMLEMPEGPRLLTLGAFQKGEDVPLNTENGRSLGRALAELHKAFDSSGPHDCFGFFDEEFFEKWASAFCNKLKDRPLQDVVRNFGYYFGARLQAHAKTSPGYGLIHGDFFHNISHSARGFAFYDFEHISWAPRIFEIAQFHWGISVRNPSSRIVIEGEPGAVWNAFLDGYRELIGLDGIEEVPAYSIARVFVDIYTAHEQSVYFGSSGLQSAFYQERAELIKSLAEYYRLKL